MRKVLRAVLVAVAVVFAMSAAPAFAQKKPASIPKPAPAGPSIVIPAAKLPTAVRTAQRRAFPKAQITKVEQIGTGKTAIYHLTMTGKKTDVRYTAAGKVVK